MSHCLSVQLYVEYRNKLRPNDWNLKNHLNRTFQLASTRPDDVSPLRISHLLLLCRLQLLHGLVVPIVDLLLQLLPMVLHRLDLLCPALLVLVQLLHTQKKKIVHSDEHMTKTALLICVRWTLSVSDTSARALLYLHSRIQPLIQLANLLSQLLQVIGLVQDVRVHLEETHRQNA